MGWTEVVHMSDVHRARLVTYHCRTAFRYKPKLHQRMETALCTDRPDSGRNNAVLSVSAPALPEAEGSPRDHGIASQFSGNVFKQSSAAFRDDSHELGFCN